MRKHEQIIEHTCLRLMFLDDNSRISKALSKTLNIVPTAHPGFIKMTRIIPLITTDDPLTV